MAGMVREAAAVGAGQTSKDIAAHERQQKQQQQLASLTEMLHTASLLHEDVIDLSSQRRATSINSIFGNKLAVLAGDFLLARTSVNLGYLRNCEVVELMTTVLEHLVHGEVMSMQMAGGLPSKGGGATENIIDGATENSIDNVSVIEQYLERQYYKTGSLIANSCQSSLILSDAPVEQQQHAFAFGKHLAMALQLSEDAVDFEQNGCQAAQLGVVTAPLLLALGGDVNTGGGGRGPTMEQILERRLAHPGDIDEAMMHVHRADGVKRTQALAEEEAVAALESLRLLAEAVQQQARQEQGLAPATASELRAFEEDSKFYRGMAGMCVHVLTKRE
jgi:hexaprenyl-diphosphate synthase